MRLNNIEGRVWAELQQLQENNTDYHFKDWLVKLLIHLEKEDQKNYENKTKEIGKVSKS